MKPTKEQQKEIKAAVSGSDGIVKFADLNKINRGHVSLAYNGKYLSPAMCRVMGWDVFVSVPEGTVENLEQERQNLEIELSILGGVIENLRNNQIPSGTVPTEPCPECNEVHLVGWCVKVDGPPIKPKPTYNKKATQPSPDDIVSLTVKMTRAQREQINETAKGRGVTTKDLVISELVESE